MVERTTKAPAIGQLQTGLRIAVVRADARVDRVRHDTHGEPCAVKDVERSRIRPAGAERVLRRTLRPARIHPDVVAGTGRDVLDQQRSRHSTTVDIARMTEVHGTGLILAEIEGGCDIVGVREVGSVVVVDRARNLEQTPGLIDPYVADEVGNRRPCRHR